jgi:8-oxo-dGTP diphosphatase
MLQARTIASVGVGVIIVKDDKVLLMKRTGSHGTDTWSCPGGHIDFGESLEECAIRETKEETGVDIQNVEFIAITNDFFQLDHKHYVTVWMRGEYTGGEPKITSPHEGTEIGWFEWDKLPQPLFVPLQNLIDGNHYPQGVSIR